MKKLLVIGYWLLAIGFVQAQNVASLTFARPNAVIMRGDSTNLVITLAGNYANQKLDFVVKSDKIPTGVRLIRKRNVLAGGGSTELTADYAGGNTTITVKLLSTDTQDFLSAKYYYDVSAQKVGSTANYVTIISGEIAIRYDIGGPLNGSQLVADGTRYVPVDTSKITNGEFVKRSGNDFISEALYSKTQIDIFNGAKADTSLSNINVSLARTKLLINNVDNTSDANKPVSTATQTALNLKSDSSTVNAHIRNVSNPHAITKAQVGLGNADNTSDLNKPISTATQTALNLKLDTLSFSSFFDNRFGLKTTTNLAEGTNLYYTDARARASISETITGINYSSGVFSLALTYFIPRDSMALVWNDKYTQAQITTFLGAKLDTTLATTLLRSHWSTAYNRSISVANDSTNWNTAYTDRLKWDGDATGLVAATGRTSLGLGTMALVDSVLFKAEMAGLYVPLTRTVNGHALTGNISVTATDVGLGNVTNESKATMFTNPIFTGTVTIPTPFTLGAVSVTTTPQQFNYLNGATGTTGTGNLVFSTSPVLITPTLGVAAGTSLALGGATIGTNALAARGTQSAAPLGGELIINGTFTTDLAGWTGITNWSWSAQTALHTAGSTVALSQNVTVISGQTYQVEITISGRTAGSISISLGGVTLDVGSGGTTMAVNQIYQRSMVAGTSGIVAFAIAPTVDFNGSIDNVTLKQVIGSSNSIIAYEDSGGLKFFELRGEYQNANDAVLFNLGLGRGVLSSITTGRQNVGVGTNTMLSMTTGEGNTGVGLETLHGTTIGTYNTAMGREALRDLTTGFYNTAMGAECLYGNHTGAGNTASGYMALSTTTLDYNTAMGFAALTSTTTGSGNVGFGKYAGETENSANANVSGSYNTWIGTETGPATTAQLTNAIALGWRAKNTKSNQVVLGNSSVTETLLNGAVYIPSLILGGTGTQFTQLTSSNSWVLQNDAGSPLNVATIDSVGNTFFSGRLRSAGEAEIGGDLYMNSYYTAGNFYYRANGFALLLAMSGGDYRFSTGTSGIAGNVVSFVERARLTNGGNLLLGTQTDDGVNKLQVNGTISSGAITSTDKINFGAPGNLKNYTVATLPTGTQGDFAYVTDALAPTFLGALTGGGTVVTPVFYNGAAWVSF